MIATSTENVNSRVTFENEEETESNIQHGKWMKSGTEQLHLPFIGKLDLKVEIQKIHWMIETIYYPRNGRVYKQGNQSIY